MIIKHSFKFLDALLEFGYYQSMLLFRFSKQIRGAIIIFYSVVMMNLPTFWDRFIMRLFPNGNMLKNIALLRCPWMLGFINLYVSLAVSAPATFPMRATLSSTSQMTTWSAQFGCGFLGIPTIRARNRFFESPFPLLGEFMFSVLYAVLTAIFFSIHTLYYTILPNNMQTLDFTYEDEGTKFTDITQTYEL